MRKKTDLGEVWRFTKIPAVCLLLQTLAMNFQILMLHQHFDWYITQRELHIFSLFISTSARPQMERGPSIPRCSTAWIPGCLAQSQLSRRECWGVLCWRSRRRLPWCRPTLPELDAHFQNQDQRRRLRSHKSAGTQRHKSCKKRSFCPSLQSLLPNKNFAYFLYFAEGERYSANPNFGPFWVRHASTPTEHVRINETQMFLLDVVAHAVGLIVPDDEDVGVQSSFGIFLQQDWMRYGSFLQRKGSSLPSIVIKCEELSEHVRYKMWLEQSLDIFE